MSSLSLSPLKDRFCVAWTALFRNFYGSEVNSGEFSFQNTHYRLQFIFKDTCRLRLIHVKGLVAESFILTVLVERRGIDNPVCQTLACERVSEVPWEITFGFNSLLKCSTTLLESGSAWIELSFLIIFENDSTSARNDNLQRLIPMECTQGDSYFLSDLDRLSLDFANLLKNKTLPDVKLKCGGRDHTIPAHRAVLAARSEVFAAMFRNEMAESRTGDVDVVDVDDDVIDPFLQYVYSGKISLSVSDEVVPGLYAAADKYAVHTLRETCRDRMVSCLTEENCVNILMVADAHGDIDFKKSVIEYICNHKDVFKGDAWREFVKKPSPLAMEVYQSKVEREI